MSVLWISLALALANALFAESRVPIRRRLLAALGSESVNLPSPAGPEKHRGELP